MQSGIPTVFVLFLICILGGSEAAPPRKCGHGWISFNGKCYYFSRTPENFRSAMHNCYNLGGRLLEIESKEEELWIDLQSRLLGYNYGVWLGFSDIIKDGQFLALSDRKRLRYVNWTQGAPNNGHGGTEHCAMYWIARRGWNDERCSIRLNYVCTK
ncbi:perlucin-like protein [Crassostrea virginica]|uniref:Perlucin-like protein n=1 Tax=Crassostrea virginica TaxID=6565 RepID=A0A8B8BNC1_CRAVI|nr:perlucin-like protein [Crassostrea virginica]